MGGGGEGEVCILRSPGIAASPISLLSMGVVCMRSFTGRQTCSLYLVLWLCAINSHLRPLTHICLIRYQGAVQEETHPNPTVVTDYSDPHSCRTSVGNPNSYAFKSVSEQLNRVLRTCREILLHYSKRKVVWLFSNTSEDNISFASSFQDVAIISSSGKKISVKWYGLQW